jgi:phage virion morphogenesis protein
MIRVELNEDEITGVLNRLARSLTDMSPVMEEIGETLAESTKQRFSEGSAPDGSKWAPKSQTTLDAYTRRGDRVNVRPLFGPSGRLSSEISYSVMPDSVEIGSNLIYSAVMQFGAAKGAFGKTRTGGSIPWGNIPARPFLGVSETDRSNLIETIEEWMDRVAQAKD